MSLFNYLIKLRDQTSLTHVPNLIIFCKEPPINCECFIPCVDPEPSPAGLYTCFNSGSHMQTPAGTEFKTFCSHLGDRVSEAVKSSLASWGSFHRVPGSALYQTSCQLFWTWREFRIVWDQWLSPGDRNWRHFKELLLGSSQHFPHKMFTICVASDGSRGTCKPREDRGWVTHHFPWTAGKVDFPVIPYVCDLPSFATLLIDLSHWRTHLALKWANMNTSQNCREE